MTHARCRLQALWWAALPVRTKVKVTFGTALHGGNFNIQKKNKIEPSYVQTDKICTLTIFRMLLPSLSSAVKDKQKEHMA